MEQTDEVYKSTDSYWKEFEKSGSISAYLRYTQTRDP